MREQLKIITNLQDNIKRNNGHTLFLFFVKKIILLWYNYNCRGGCMDQEKIGKFIKDIRLKQKMTQQEFANKWGVTYQVVSKW